MFGFSAPCPPWYSDPLTRVGQLQLLAFYGVATPEESAELREMTRSKIESFFASELDSFELRARKLICSRYPNERRDAEACLRMCDYIRSGVSDKLALKLMREIQVARFGPNAEKYGFYHER